MLKVLAYTCFLASLIKASGLEKDLHPSNLPLAFPTGQPSASPQFKKEGSKYSKTSDRVIRLPKRGDKSHRLHMSPSKSPSTFTGHRFVWVPKHHGSTLTDSPTGTPLYPKKRNPSKLHEPHVSRTDRQFDQRLPKHGNRSSKYNRDKLYPVGQSSRKISPASRPFPVKSRHPHVPKYRYVPKQARPSPVSAFSETEFGKAIDASDFAKIKELGEKDRKVWEEGIKHVIETKNPDFIIDIIQQNDIVNAYVLAMLFLKGSETVIEEVLAKINFTQEHFADAASFHETMCSSRKFIDLFGRITMPNLQINAIRNGIQAIVLERTY